MEDVVKARDRAVAASKFWKTVSEWGIPIGVGIGFGAGIYGGYLLFHK